jgi:glycosyltransferase involved in cell wall biosynthesis
MKTFLLFDSLGVKNEFVAKLAGSLAADGCQPLVLTKPGSPLAQVAKDNGWPLGSYLLPAVPQWFLLVTGFVWRLIFLIRLVAYKQRFKIGAVVCLGWPAKFLAAWPARLSGLKVVWLELPNFNYETLGKLGLKLYCFLAAKAKLVCFSLTSKLALLALGLAEERISLIWPGIEPAEFQNQINLFQNLAAQNYTPAKKFFTIGTVLDLAEPQRSEILMRSLKAAKDIVPRLRLIVIGDGAARQQAQWLSKKMGLASAVWLVGSQSDLPKWYANFDLFVVASSRPGLDDFLTLLGAMINGVPVIAPHGLSLEDCFLGGQAGILLSLDDVEELTAAIIKLQQNQLLRKNLSLNAKRVARDFFALSRAKAEFQAVLNN